MPGLFCYKLRFPLYSMKLAADAHAHIESFLREYFVDNTLRLPPVTLHCGYLAAHLTGLLKIGAITLGRRVVIAPALVRREKERLTIPGWLIAHEAVHVLQYERARIIVIRQGA
jgi:hypothetical protein